MELIMMERLSIENRKLKEKVVSQKLEIADLKNKIRIEISKYRILKYNKSNPSTSRTSMYDYKIRIKESLQLFNLELQKVNFSLGSVYVNKMPISATSNEPIAAETASSVLNITNTEVSSLESHSNSETDITETNYTDASNASITDASVITNDEMTISQTHKEFFIVYNDPFIENTVDKCLYFKDKISLADHKYHSFRNGMNFKKTMAPLGHIKKRKMEINNDVDITALSNGYYIDPVRYIKMQINNYLKNSISENQDNVIWVKLTCDGTQISRSIKITNFAFSIINEKIKAATASGCYRIAAFQQGESYDEIKEWLPYLWGKIKALTRIRYDPINGTISDESNTIGNSGLDAQKIYEIKYFFSADWKVMAIILGLKGPTSNYPCLYCEQNKAKLDEIGTLKKLI